MSTDFFDIDLFDYPISYDLKTQRLDLRALVKEDAGELYSLMSDARLTTFLAWEPHQCVEETINMIQSLGDAQQAGKGFHWAVTVDQNIIGLVSLIDIRRQHRSWVLNRAELAYWVALKHQGKGYATEAAAVVVGFGFRRLGLHKIIVFHAVTNPQSGRVIQKLGFRFVGEEQEFFFKNGKWHNLRLFEMLVSEHQTMPK